MSYATYLVGATALVVIFYSIFSYSVITYNGVTLTLQNRSKFLLLEDITGVKTWWSYDFGMSTIEMTGDGTQGKSRPHINKVNVFAKFESPNGKAIIFEQIEMGDKFPNNHPYLHNEPIDKSILIKVWDVDKCLKKINIVPNII